tara:strand:- start:74 stop:358 length:285 start_codon:yes stop_codon:yes gene_type:complete
MQVCRFRLNESISREDTEAHIAFAIVSAECTFGKAKVRLNGAYLAAESKVVIDVSSPVGEHIAEIFTGLLIKEYGDESFRVKRIRDKDNLRRDT